MRLVTELASFPGHVGGLGMRLVTELSSFPGHVGGLGMRLVTGLESLVSLADDSPARFMHEQSTNHISLIKQA